MLPKPRCSGIGLANTHCKAVDVHRWLSLTKRPLYSHQPCSRKDVVTLGMLLVLVVVLAPSIGDYEKEAADEDDS